MISLLLLALLALPAWGFIVGTSILSVPDDDGQFDRDTWNPTNGSFPAVGGTYTDPVFSEVITRLTDVYPGSGSPLSTHHQWNADGTKFFWYQSNQAHVLNTAGTQVETNIPGGFGTGEDAQWSPFDPDLYYYTSSQSIWRRNIATDTTTEIKNFGANITGNGGKSFMVVHPEDDTANPPNLLFVVTIGGTSRVWDMARDTVLGGTLTNTDTRWVGLTPDGRWIVRAGNTSAVMFSLPINVLASTMGDGTTSGQTGTVFWENMCFDHGDLVSLTNGKSYLITGACSFERWHYRVDVSLNQSGRTQTQQAADNLRLFQTDASGQTGNTHYSCAMQGAMKNWCAAANEDTNETAATPGTWYANKQEVLLIHMLSGKVFRLVHHRSYPLSGFCSNARVNLALTGVRAFYTSAHGLGGAEATCGYGDLFLLELGHLTAFRPHARRRLLSFD